MVADLPTLTPGDFDSSFCESDPNFGYDCRQALDQCKTSNPDCLAILQCLERALSDRPAIFPSDCIPPEFGNPALYFCRLIDCGGRSATVCDLVKIWCSPNGTVNDPTGRATVQVKSVTATKSQTAGAAVAAATTTTAPGQGSGQLAFTGGRIELTYVLGLVVLLLGLLTGIGGAMIPTEGRMRGGFTVQRTLPTGDVATSRIVAQRTKRAERKRSR